MKIFLSVLTATATASSSNAWAPWSSMSSSNLGQHLADQQGMQQPFLVVKSGVAISAWKRHGGAPQALSLLKQALRAMVLQDNDDMLPDASGPQPDWANIDNADSWMKDLGEAQVAAIDDLLKAFNNELTATECNLIKKFLKTAHGMADVNLSPAQTAAVLNLKHAFGESLNKQQYRSIKLRIAKAFLEARQLLTDSDTDFNAPPPSLSDDDDDDSFFPTSSTWDQPTWPSFEDSFADSESVAMDDWKQGLDELQVETILELKQAFNNQLTASDYTNVKQFLKTTSDEVGRRTANALATNLSPTQKAAVMKLKQTFGENLNIAQYQRIKQRIKQAFASSSSSSNRGRHLLAGYGRGHRGAVGGGYRRGGVGGGYRRGGVAVGGYRGGAVVGGYRGGAVVGGYRGGAAVGGIRRSGVAVGGYRGGAVGVGGGYRRGGVAVGGYRGGAVVGGYRGGVAVGGIRRSGAAVGGYRGGAVGGGYRRGGAVVGRGGHGYRGGARRFG